MYVCVYCMCLYSAFDVARVLGKVHAKELLCEGKTSRQRCIVADSISFPNRFEMVMRLGEKNDYGTFALCL